MLSGACPPGMIRLVCEVTGVIDHGDHATIALATGGTGSASVVVGADGVHSRLRSLIDPDARPVCTGTSGFRGIVPVTDLPTLPDPRAIQFWTGPDAHLPHYASVPQSAHWPLYTLPPLPRWSRGRVVLLGDAARTMLPHHGQGANQSIEDAVVLADLLAGPGALDGGHDTAFARYEQLRRGRTRQVQRSSLVTSGLLHLPDGADARARDAKPAGLDPWLTWIHGTDARAQTRPAAVPA